MPHTLLGQLTYAALLILSGATLILGRGAFRWSGLVLLIGTVIYPLLQDRHIWSDPVTLVLPEGVELAWFIGATLYNRSLALILATAFELLYVATIVSHQFTRTIVGPYVYISLLQVWTLGHYGSVFVGALLSAQTRRAAKWETSQP